MREGRRVTIENVPDPLVKGAGVMIKVYQMFRHFNVLAVRFAKHRAPKAHLSGWLATLDFETRSEAQQAIGRFNVSLLSGRRITLGVSRPPMKHLGGV